MLVRPIVMRYSPARNNFRSHISYSLIFSLVLNLTWMPAGYSATREDRCAKSLAEIAKATVRITAWVGYNTSKALLYPAGAPIDFSVRSIYHYFKQGRKGLMGQAVRRLVRDVPHITAFLLLSFLGQATNMSITEFDDETAAQEAQAPPGLVVIVDAHPEEDILTKVGFVAQRSKLYSNARVIRVSSAKELIQKLKAISVKEGPIGLLEFEAHGEPGYTTPLSAYEIDRFADEVSGKGTMTVEGVEIDPRGIFAKGALVKFVSCAFGSGAKGDNLCEGFHTALLVPNGGGHTMAARVTLHSLPGADFYVSDSPFLPPPKVIGRVETILYRPFNGIEALWKGKDLPNNNYPLTNLPLVFNRVSHYESSERFASLRKELLPSMKKSESVAKEIRDFNDGVERKVKSRMSTLIEAASEDGRRNSIFLKDGELVISPIGPVDVQHIEKLKRDFPEARIKTKTDSGTFYMYAAIPDQVVKEMADEAEHFVREILDFKTKQISSEFDRIFQNEREGLIRNNEAGTISNEELASLSKEIESLNKFRRARILNDYWYPLSDLAQWSRALKGK